MPPSHAPSHNNDPAFLPRDLFWILVGYLAPADLVRCRRVSRAWNEAFGNPDILFPLLKSHFSWTREAKGLQSGSCNIKGCNFRQLFDQVASRYHYLQRGEPRSVQKYRLCDDFGSSGEREWFQIQPWEWHSSQIDESLDYTFSEAMWTHEEGLLVYPSADHQCLVLMDLSNDRHFMVPFIIRGKVVRRVRLQKRLLVVEWAEPKAFHWLNESEGVHRHFASSFDVTKTADGGWSIAPRNEWKIMFLGHPLSERDRFYSSHNNTRYVIYLWQPNRSLYTADEDAPIESMIVWDISKPSLYRPSIDPTRSQTGPEVDQAPSIVARFGFQDLDSFWIRQRGMPSLQRLNLTDDGQAIEFTQTDAVDGWTHLYPGARTTVIPFEGNGPFGRRRESLSFFPAYRGHLVSEPLPIELGDDFYTNSWYWIISMAADDDMVVSFHLHLDPNYSNDSTKLHTINLSIETSEPPVVDDFGNHLLRGNTKTRVTRDGLDFEGRGKICGCDRYLLGENCNRELVIYRFDR